MESYVLFNEGKKEYFSSFKYEGDNIFNLVFSEKKELAWRYASMDEALKEIDYLINNKKAGNNVKGDLKNIKVTCSPWYETIIYNIIEIIKDTHGVIYEYKECPNCDGFFGFYHPFHDNHKIEFSKEYVAYGSPMLLPYSFSVELNKLRKELFDGK